MRIGIALPGHLAAILGGEAERNGHEVLFAVTGRVALAVELAERAPEALLVAAHAELLDERLLEDADRLGIRLVGIAVDRRGTPRVRGVPVLAAGAAWPEVAAALAGAAEAAGPEPEASGAVVAVWGPEGAPGRTTTAIALAAAIGASGRGVALVDADTRAASVALVLGLVDESPGIAAVCRLASLGALDAPELDRLAEPLPGAAGVEVLTGIVRADRWPELSGERVRRALQACRAWRAVTVVDVAAGVERDEELVADELAPRRNAATLAVLAAADLVVLVGAADPVGVARMIDAAAALPEHTGARVLPVVNRVRGSAIGGPDPRRQLVSTLERFGGIRDPVLVPHDLAAADRALRSGLPLPVAAARSQTAAAHRRLAAAVLAALAAAPAEAADRGREAPAQPVA